MNVAAATPGEATEAVSEASARAWRMRTNFIDYHQRLQQKFLQQGKPLAEETSDGLMTPLQHPAQELCGVDEQTETDKAAPLHATSVTQTVFNVVRDWTTLTHQPPRWCTL